MKKYIENTSTIYAAKDEMQAGQKVNAIAKYIKKHIDGAYKLSFSPMTADVYITIYYDIPSEAKEVMKKYGAEPKQKGVESMDIDINITSYQNKVRINVIRMDDNEKTLGQLILKPEDIKDLYDVVENIKDKVSSFIEKEYADYDFVF